MSPEDCAQTRGQKAVLNVVTIGKEMFEEIHKAESIQKRIRKASRQFNKEPPI